MINVVSAVAAATAVQAPARIYSADAKDTTTRAPHGFDGRDTLARVFRNLFAAREMLCGKAAFAVDAGFFDAQAGREFKFHLEIKFEI